MNTFKNIEIAREYNVSSSTVTRWVQLAQEQKNNLQLYKTDSDKFLILDNPHNRAEIARLVDDGKKYRSNIDCKRVNISKKIYDLFTVDQIIDIFNGLDIKKEIKLKYSYKDAGAKFWDVYYHSSTSLLKTANTDLLDNTLKDILYFIGPDSRMNLVDIGPGNAYPVKNIISELNNLSLLNKYITIDLSKEILDIAERNIQEWFKGIVYKSYEADIETSRFNTIFLENSSISQKISNIILHIGNTMGNHDDRIQILKNLRSGMIKEDIFVTTFTLDTIENRSALNYVKGVESDLQDTWALSELGVDIDKCEIRVWYNNEINAKIKTLKLDKDYVLYFNILGEKRELELFSGDEIVIWKHYLISETQFIFELEQADLRLLDLKLDKSLSNALVVAQIKK